MQIYAYPCRNSRTSLQNSSKRSLTRCGSRSCKRGRLLSSLVLLVTMIVGAVVGLSCWLRGSVVLIDLSSLTPFPLALTVDRLSAFFLLLISVVAAPVVLFSTSYTERHYAGAS